MQVQFTFRKVFCLKLFPILNISFVFSCLDVLVEQVAKYKEQFVQAVQEVCQITSTTIIYFTKAQHFIT